VDLRHRADRCRHQAVPGGAARGAGGSDRQRRVNGASRFGTPHKGPGSYQVEEAGTVFRRDRGGERPVASILSSPFTPLPAQSGAGKTSLLNAEVIPTLEEKGWIPVRVLPQNDPTASVWVSTLGYVLPPVRAELLALRRIRKVLSDEGEN